MNNLQISSRRLAQLFWELICKEHFMYPGQVNELLKKLKQLEYLTDQAAYKTGSISSISALILYYLTKYFQPEKILEVGTYIGKSTISMAYAMDENKTKNSYIATCDASNDIKLPWKGHTKLNQYRLSTSTTMMENEKDKFDFIFLDGRLQAEDMKFLDKLCHEKTIFVLDDFEGTEKGVLNLIALQNIPNFKRYRLIRPPSSTFLEKINPFSVNCPTAVFLPLSLIVFVNQG